MSASATPRPPVCTLRPAAMSSFGRAPQPQLRNLKVKFAVPGDQWVQFHAAAVPRQLTPSAPNKKTVRPDDSATALDSPANIHVYVDRLALQDHIVDRALCDLEALARVLGFVLYVWKVDDFDDLPLSTLYDLPNSQAKPHEVRAIGVQQVFAFVADMAVQRALTCVEVGDLIPSVIAKEINCALLRLETEANYIARATSENTDDHHGFCMNRYPDLWEAFQWSEFLRRLRAICAAEAIIELHHEVEAAAMTV